MRAIIGDVDDADEDKDDVIPLGTADAADDVAKPGVDIVCDVIN
jgi:hypothetical protein